jgi:hypothetical protein
MFKVSLAATNVKIRIQNMNMRRTTAADSSGVARVRVQTWQAAYRGVVPDAYLVTQREQV